MNKRGPGIRVQAHQSVLRIAARLWDSLFKNRSDVEPHHIIAL
jgi:hypothetical protein